MPKSTIEDSIDTIADGQASNVASEFGARLRDAAAYKSLKSIDIARMTGLKKATAHTYFSGTRMCSADRIFTIADVLNVSPRWLATGVGAKEPAEELFRGTDEEFDLIGTFRHLAPADRRAVMIVASRLLDLRRELWEAKELSKPIELMTAEEKLERIRRDQAAASELGTLHDPALPYRGQKDG